MKVIKKAKSYKVTCPRCLSVLEFEFSDIEFREGLTSYAHGVVYCPVCHETIKVNKHQTGGAGGTEMNDNVTAYFEPEEGCCVNMVEGTDGK